MLLACLALLPGNALTAAAAPLRQDSAPTVADDGESHSDGSSIVTPTLMPTTAQTLTAEQRAQIDRVVQLTNAERAKQGLAPLQPNPNLMTMAQDYAGVLAPGPCFAHDCPPVPSPVDRARNAGYPSFTRLGENIAAGYGTPAAVVRGWMESPEHRFNILKPEYQEIGVGVSTGSGEYGIYWVQEFGTRQG